MDNREIKAKAMMAQGKSVREAAEMTGAHYTTVTKWKKQLEEDAEKRKAQELIQIDPVALQAVTEEIQEKATIELDTGPILKGAKGLQILEEDFQNAARALLTRGMELSDDESLTPNGWKTLTSGMAEMYSALFKNNGTNIQINNSQNVASDSAKLFPKGQR